jgi:hypothetical protein
MTEGDTLRFLTLDGLTGHSSSAQLLNSGNVRSGLLAALR